MRKHLTKSQRQHVYEKYNGHCAYCGCELDIKDMQVDHIKSDYLGGELDSVKFLLTPSYRKRVKSKNIKELVLIERR